MLKNDQKVINLPEGDPLAVVKTTVLEVSVTVTVPPEIVVGAPVSVNVTVTVFNALDCVSVAGTVIKVVAVTVAIGIVVVVVTDPWAIVVLVTTTGTVVTWPPLLCKKTPPRRSAESHCRGVECSIRMATVSLYILYTVYPIRGIPVIGSSFPE